MGRSSIVYVIGLTIIVGLSLRVVSGNSVRSMDVYLDYYGLTQVHDIAVSGANVGTNYLLGAGVLPPNFGVDFFGGHDSVLYLQNIPRTEWVTVRSVAWTASLDQNGLPYRDTVDAEFKHVQFAKYSWFTENEVDGYMAPDGTNGPYYGSDDWKITGDSVWGPAHTNGTFNLDGTPYFDALVTSGHAPNLGPSGHPVFNVGINYPVNQSRPSTAMLQANLTSAATLGGGYFDQSGTPNDVSLTFMNDRVRVQIPPGGGVRDTTMYLSTLASNGVIVVRSADIHMRGTYQGDYTVAAFTGTAANKGNVWIDGDVVAATNPVTNPASTDMLGIVAERMAYITQDLTRTSSSTINVQAAVYCQRGELTAQNFWNIPVSGRVSLFGGVTQNTAGSLGLSAAGPPITLLSGFSYSIRNDPRFVTKQPPFFPASPSYELVSWWEK